MQVFKYFEYMCVYVCVYVCSVYGSVRVEGLGAEHISDDSVFGPAVCGRPDNSEWMR